MSTSAPLDSLAPRGSEAAAQLGLSRSHFREMTRDGRAPRAVKLGRASHWRLDELAVWLAAGGPPRLRWDWQATEGGAR